jgi:succinoglycan biosynthesis transport protein ExoP
MRQHQVPLDVHGWTPPGLSSEPLVRLSWSRYATTLRRHKWLVASVVVLGAAAGIGVTRTLVPEYEAHATVRIADAADYDDGAMPIRSNAVMRPNAWPELLTSFAILDGVVRKLSLYLTPESASDSSLFAGFDVTADFRPGGYELRIDDAGWQYRLLDGQGRTVQAGLTGDSIGRALGFRWRPPPGALGRARSVKFVLATPREAALELRRQLTITLPDGSNLVDITFKGSDPARTAAVVDALLDQLMATATALRTRNETEIRKTLKEQLALAERELGTAESALEGSQASGVSVLTEASPAAGNDAQAEDPLLIQYDSARSEYENLRSDRRAITRALSLVQEGGLSPDALWASPAIQRNATADWRAALASLATKEEELRAARLIYTDNHESVHRLQREVAEITRTRIPQAAEAMSADLQQRERELGARIGLLTQQRLSGSQRLAEAARLQRNVGASARLVALLKNRSAEATLAEENTIPNLSVVEAPVVPQRPSLDRAPFIILLALMASGGVAMLFAVVRDHFDARFRYLDQATDELGLDVLGLVPPGVRTSGGRLGGSEAAALLESFRAIRLNLTQALRSPARVTMTVSSPGPGDGKSFVSANLAWAFTEAGYRTLLVDGDIVRGELHGRFGVERAPGLLDLLAGTAELDATLQPSGRERLTVMTRGETPPGGVAELMVTAKVSALIRALERRFDAIIVDSPPLAAGVDPLVLGAATGAMLLVVRVARTDRRVAEAKLRLLARLPIRVLGTVVNEMHDQGSELPAAYPAPSETHRRWLERASA